MTDSPARPAEAPPPHQRTGLLLVREAITQTHAGRIAVVSSFGAQSALLLALIAEIDRNVPVLFIDTLKHFPETLAYRDRLETHLGLRDVLVFTPDPADVVARDPRGGLHAFQPDECCALRKVAPLAQALAPFEAWINGRKRFQTADRAALPFRETIDGRTKFNPLADWSASEIAAEIQRRHLPAHPLAAAGFASIGCAPCTRAVSLGEEARAGRWSGFTKTECGIHPPARRTGTARP